MNFKMASFAPFFLVIVMTVTGARRQVPSSQAINAASLVDTTKHEISSSTDKTKHEMSLNFQVEQDSLTSTGSSEVTNSSMDETKHEMSFNMDFQGEQHAPTTAGSHDTTNSSLTASWEGSFCTTAACCKTLARVPEDGQVCEDFYNSRVGVAFQMVSPGKWAKFAGGRGGFHSSPPTWHLTGKDQQSVSITHSGKTPCPYPGAGAAWGMLLTVSRRSNFWQFFQKCPSGALTGQCTDGYKCGAYGRTPLINTAWTYEQFEQAKNAVVEQTGTWNCKNHLQHQYNEFNTNGLSKSAVAGVFLPKCLAHKGKPSSGTACSALTKLNPAKRQWPVYDYSYQGSSASLRLTYYLNC